MEDIIYSKVLVLPKVTKAVRDTMKAEIGMIVYNTDSKTLNVSRVASVGSTAWTVISST